MRTSELHLQPSGELILVNPDWIVMIEKAQTHNYTTVTLGAGAKALVTVTEPPETII